MKDRIVGKFWWKKRWYSVCSSHFVYEDDCPRCRVGSWENLWRIKIGNYIYNLCPEIWMWWANRKLK